VDHGRAYIEQHYRRPLPSRMFRGLLAWALPNPRRFRVLLTLARLAQPLRPVFARITAFKPLAAALALAADAPSPAAPAVSRASDPKGRVILLQGCVENELRPDIRAATVRLLNRAGYEVVFAPQEVCCGSLVRHMGKDAASLDYARRNVDAWSAVCAQGDVQAILVTASGCGTTIKDYGFMLRDDPRYAAKAAQVATLAKDISEFLDGIALPAARASNLVVAYQAPCSLQHGQKVVEAPQRLLAKAGFTVRTPRDMHLCCGSAGTYNILQPDLAQRLGDRKAAAIAALRPDIIAAGNVGCMMQIGRHAKIPVVHPVELLDWATGGPRPAALDAR
jgi:glycolate oxidase iron-sulfur subunit